MRHIAIKNLYPDTRMINGESDVRDVNDVAIEIDEDLIQQELVKLQAEYDAQAYARNRAAEYPSIAELTVALYDTEDKAAIETKRAAVKAKYPKPS